MKYNEEIFNVSAQFYKDIQDVETTDEIEQMQNELLTILLKKFAETLEEDKTQNKGIVRIRFVTKFWVDYDRGTNLLTKLIDAKQFDAFANQYCIYLGKDSRECDERSNGCIEVIWDYKTYLEFLSMSQSINKTGEDNCVSQVEESLKEVKKREIIQQREDLENFASKVSEYRNAISQKDVVKLDLKGEV